MSSNLPPLTGDPSKDLPPLTGDPSKDFGPKQSPEPRVISAPVEEEKGMPLMGVPHLAGALKDIIARGRPQADVIGRAVFQPKNIGEAAVREAIMAPTAAVSMPLRVLTSGASGAVERLGGGHSLGEAGWAAVLNAATAGATEGLLRGGAAVASRIGRKAEKVADPLIEGRAAATRGQEAFERSLRTPQELFDKIKHRLPPGKQINAPTLSGKPMTAQDAITKLGDPKLTGPDYKAALAEVAKEFDRLDIASHAVTPGGAFIQNPASSLAGGRLTASASPYRVTPRPAPSGTYFQQLAERTMGGAEGTARTLNAPVTRAAADVAATTPTGEGIPAGAFPFGAAADQFGHLAQYLRYHIRP